MRPWVHFLFSLILALILYPIFNWKVLLIFIGGVLVDLDHCFLYIRKFKKFNLLGCYRYYMDRNNTPDHMDQLQIFHTIELLLISTIFSIYSQLALMFTIGLLSHYIGDVIFRYKITKSFISNPSVIAWIIKNKN